MAPRTTYHDVAPPIKTYYPDQTKPPRPMIPRGSKLDRIRTLLSDNSFVENKARALVRRVFAEEEVKVEALLIEATKAKLKTIDSLFKKLDILEQRFFEPVTKNGETYRLVDVMSSEDLIDLYKTLGRTMMDMYKDVQDDVESLKKLEAINKTGKTLTRDLTQEQRELLKGVIDKVLAKVGINKQLVA